MSVSVDREFLTQALIVLSTCLGGWMLLVKPGAEELSELQRVIEQRRVKATAMDPAMLQTASQHAPWLRERSAQIQNKGVLAKDSSVLYGLIMNLAKSHDVQVKNLRPGVEHQKGGRDKAFIVSRIDMTVDGEYQDIAAFLDDMDDIGAYLRPVSVQIAPTKGESGSHTVMQLGFEALRFSLPKVIKAIEDFKP